MASQSRCFQTRLKTQVNGTRYLEWGECLAEKSLIMLTGLQNLQPVNPRTESTEYRVLTGDQQSVVDFYAKAFVDISIEYPYCSIPAILQQLEMGEAMLLGEECGALVWRARPIQNHLPTNECPPLVTGGASS